MSQVSVIIVSWNARRFLKDCIESVRRTGGRLVREIVVVDNASTDGSPEMVKELFPEVTLVRASTNLGFAKANNLGMKHCRGDFLALVNSDVIVHPECFQKLAALLDSREQVGLVGPRIIGADGHVQHTCRQLPTVWNTLCRFLALDRVFSRWRLFAGFQMRHWDYNSLAEVEVLSGCFWLARRSAVEDVGSLDERFFFYAEDIDWCKRFRDAGWKIMFVPEASATHFGGGSSGNAPLRYSIEMLRANLLYWKKHHGSLGRLSYYCMALVQHLARLVVRGVMRFVGAQRAESERKLKEHAVCLRWLLTGKGV